MLRKIKNKNMYSMWFNDFVESIKKKLCNVYPFYHNVEVEVEDGVFNILVDIHPNLPLELIKHFEKVFYKEEVVFTTENDVLSVEEYMKKYPNTMITYRLSFDNYSQFLNEILKENAVNCYVADVYMSDRKVYFVVEPLKITPL